MTLPQDDYLHKLRGVQIRQTAPGGSLQDGVKDDYLRRMEDSGRGEDVRSTLVERSEAISRRVRDAGAAQERSAAEVGRGAARRRPVRAWVSSVRGSAPGCAEGTVVALFLARDEGPEERSAGESASREPIYDE